MYEEKEEKGSARICMGIQSFKLLLRAERCRKQLGRGLCSTRMAESVIDMVRAQAEESDKGLDTIMTLQSSAGGTGAGLGARATKTLRDEFGGGVACPSTW